MTMRSRFAAGGMATALALTGVSAATIGTAWAVTAETDGGSSTTAPDGTTGSNRLVQALAGLVEDGTITQEQSEAVASVLTSSDVMPGGMRGGMRGGMGDMHGPGMPGDGHAPLGVVGETLGLTEDEVRAAMHEGRTLAELADEQSVPVGDLVDALVAERQSRLDEAVADGRIAQSQADDLSAGLRDRVTEHVEEGTWMPASHGPGRGHGMRGGFADTQDDADDAGSTLDG